MSARTEEPHARVLSSSAWTWFPSCAHANLHVTQGGVLFTFICSLNAGHWWKARSKEGFFRWERPRVRVMDGRRVAGGVVRFIVEGRQRAEQHFTRLVLKQMVLFERLLRWSRAPGSHQMYGCS